MKKLNNQGILAQFKKAIEWIEGKDLSTALKPIAVRPSDNPYSFRRNARHFAVGLALCAGLLTAPLYNASADMIADIPAQLSLNVKSASAFSNMQAYPALFKSDEERNGNLKPFTKWVNMFDRFQRDLNKSESKALVKTWQKDLMAFQGLSLKATADKVNRFVNDVKYVSDSKNWGQSDYWATPAEFLARGGDCEDYAIAKYTALRILGVPEERLRVAIVHDNLKNIPHAVLIVYTDEGGYILDNQNERLMSADDTGRYRPIFSINRTAWWLHTAPSAKTIIASAE